MRRIVLAFLFLTGICGAQEIRRPTAEVADSGSVLCGTTGAPVSPTAAPNFYDGTGNTTSSVVSVSDGGGGVYGGRMFQTWASASGGYSALNLIVDVSPYVEAPGDAGVEYSVNGGSTWTTVIYRGTTGTTARTAYTVALSASQNLALLKVRACAYNNSTGVSSVTGWDIRTEGTLGSTRKIRISGTL